MSVASLEAILTDCGRGRVAPARVRLMSMELLAALRQTGMAHVYGDTADRDELRRVLTRAGDGVVAEVDGNTVNQPLVRRVLG